ncbi:MAG: FAD-binding protein [Deltaproteobacteria bacterium]|nr:FAD-binding protein [Deltaproteobacteria bacterium]
MSETNLNLSRRKFMLASSAAIASPLLLKLAHPVPDAQGAERKVAAKVKIYYINRTCIGCQVCRTFCPAKAIRFGDCRNEIDQKKCMSCGTCYRGCPVSAISEIEIGAPYYEEKKNTAIKVMDCDLVVMGAGGAGMVAAVKAADLTGKKVIILEKAKKVGGATIFATDMGESGPIIDSQWHKEAGYTINDPPDITGQFFDWLVSKGGAEGFFRIYKPGEEKRVGGNTVAIYMPERQEKYKDKLDESIGPGKMGSYVVDKMVECCEKKGIPVLTETRARKFITDDKGRVTGVLADTKDGGNCWSTARRL